MGAASKADTTPTKPLAHSPARPRHPLIIGLDAGGTKTVCLLASAADGTILGRGVGGPGNIHAAGTARVATALTEAIGAAFAAARLATETATVAAAAIGAAGAARDDDRAAVELLLREAITAGRYAVTNDGAIALRAALPTGVGALLISGTGSIGYGRTADGQEVRAGGWGYLLDDAGSAYAVGLAALTAILHAHDGRGPATALHTPLLAAWQLSVPKGIIAHVYQQPPPREAIAALAPLVLAAAQGGTRSRAGSSKGPAQRSARWRWRRSAASTPRPMRSSRSSPMAASCTRGRRNSSRPSSARSRRTDSGWRNAPPRSRRRTARSPWRASCSTADTRDRSARQETGRLPRARHRGDAPHHRLRPPPPRPAPARR